MGSRWSIRRRTAPSRTQLPQWHQSKSSGLPEKPAASPQSVVRTEVKVNPANGSKGPRTVITIRRGYKQPAPEALSGTKCELQPAFEPRVRASQLAQACTTSAPTAQVKAKIAPQHAAELSVEDDLASFGIDAPGSPSSTLNDLSESVYSRLNSVTASTSLTSMHSVATAIDDGLSPWGLPTVMDCAEDAQEWGKHGNVGLNDDGDLDSIDFGSALTPAADAQHLVKDLRLPQDLPATPEEARDTDTARKQTILTLAYFMELVAKHRAEQSSQRALKRRVPQTAAPEKHRIPDLHISHFGSWV